MRTVQATMPSLVILSYLMLLRSTSFAQETAWLSDMDLSVMRQGWGEAQIDKSVQGKPLAMSGRTFEQGVGTHAKSVLHVQLDGKVEHFRAQVGMDDKTDGKGSITFQVYGDGRRLFDSGIIKGGDHPRDIGCARHTNGFVPERRTSGIQRSGDEPRRRIRIAALVCGRGYENGVPCTLCKTR